MTNYESKLLNDLDIKNELIDELNESLSDRDRLLNVYQKEIERLKADLKVQSDGRDSEVNARNIIIKSLEQDKQRLKAERVELVKWVWEEASNLRTTISIEDAESLISEYYNILKEFDKEK